MNVRVTNPIQMKQGLDHVRCDEPICSRNQDSLSKKSIPRQIRGENRLQVLFNNGMIRAEQWFPSLQILCPRILWRMRDFDAPFFAAN